MKYLLLFPFVLLCSSTIATTWHVGPAQLYTMPSQVSTLVQYGDTVDIEAGVYAMDVAKWSAHNLVLRGVGGMAQLQSGGLVYGGKAIWVIAGDNALVENIEFSEATCVDQNGAGIRQEGHNLTVRHCKFFDNQMGILAGDLSPSHILVEFSEFANNGAGDGYSHNIYINHVDTFTFRYNYSHDAWVGHDYKSRAHVNYILYNRISDEAGDASRCIDLPNGGTSYIIGNVIEQGPLSQNQDIIGYGLEGLTNPTPHELYAINNTIVNNRSNAIYFHVDPATVLVKAYNNIIAGPGAFITGNPLSVDTLANVFSVEIDSLYFVDASAYDFRLTDSSYLAIDHGVNAGFANGMSLNPTLEYVHPADVATRCLSGFLDVGAHEFCELTSIVNAMERSFSFYPNPTSAVIHFNALQKNVSIINVLGEIVFETYNVANVNLNGLVEGLYFLKTDYGIHSIVLNR